MNVAEQLRTQGRARHAFAGLASSAITPLLARDLDLPVQSGLLVTTVTAGGRAARAGIRPGSIVRSLDAKPVTSVEAFLAALRTLEPGSTVPVTVIPPGGRSPATVKVILADRP